MLISDGISCKTKRAIIKTKHSSLYKGIVKHHETGIVKDGDAFIHLLREGRRKNSEILVYTYVIHKKNLWFSPTGDEFLKDVTSKHLIHSNCAEKVTYAGEFFLYKNKDENDEKTFTLVINNSSGTYKPDKTFFPNLKQLLEYNFPGLSVECLDTEDDKLKQYEKEIKEYNDSLDELFNHHPFSFRRNK